MSTGNRMVTHCNITAVQSKRTKKIVLYIDNKRVLQVRADCVFGKADLIRLIDRHRIISEEGSIDESSEGKK